MNNSIYTPFYVALFFYSCNGILYFLLSYMQMNENKIFREYAGPFLSKAGTFASVDCRSGKFLTLENKRNQFGFIGKAGK